MEDGTPGYVIIYCATGCNQTITESVFLPKDVTAQSADGGGEKPTEVYSTYQQSANPSAAGIRRLEIFTDEDEFPTLRTFC